MEKSLNSSSHITTFSSLRNNSLIDDYESGMEASASSMASEEETEETEETRKKSIDIKALNKVHRRRMSSGNSSTDSNATNTKLKTSLRMAHSTRLTSTTKNDDLPTPSSGYDGDTEGPLNEDIVPA